MNSTVDRQKELNEKIAELCGMRHIYEDHGSFMIDVWLPKPYIDLTVSVDTLDRFSIPLPDYCNDLNAMHEAEKRIPVGLLDAYSINLSYEILVACKDTEMGATWKMWHVSALQRAEAFVKTMEAK